MLRNYEQDSFNYSRSLLNASPLRRITRWQGYTASANVSRKETVCKWKQWSFTRSRDVTQCFNMAWRFEKRLDKKKKHDISIGSFHLSDIDHEKLESSYKRWTIREIPTSTFFTYICLAMKAKFVWHFSSITSSIFHVVIKRRNLL